MYAFKTPFMGYACEWSPFEQNKLAIATSQHFGVVGNGKQHIIQVDTRGIIAKSSILPNQMQQQQIVQPLPCKQLAIFNTNDGIYDCAWSELNENHLLSACGDGKIRLWDVISNSNPLRAYIGHNSEIYAVDWNIISKQHFLSGSWDQSIKLWDPIRAVCLGTYLGHKAVIYDVKWCPHNNFLFASTSEDRNLLIWDERKPSNQMNSNTGCSILSIPGHNHEILSCDFSKYDKNLIATGSCDTSVKLWDLRKINKPLTILNGHKYAVRRIRFSPHHPSMIMSVSYDMSVIFWDFMSTPNPLISRYDQHTEFVIGCSFNLFIENLIATCSWDEKCCVFINKYNKLKQNIQLPQQLQQNNNANIMKIPK
eukprot:67381_1